MQRVDTGREDGRHSEAEMGTEDTTEQTRGNIDIELRTAP
jgi:hypothetical protein